MVMSNDKKNISLIFPNQLFKNSDLIDKAENICIIEEYLFFKQYNFHKQKILFHRMSMKFYEEYISQNKNIKYINSYSEESDIRKLITSFQGKVDKLSIYDPNDNWLMNRIKKSCEKINADLIIYENPLFVTKKSDLHPFFREDKKKFFQTSFYKSQRQKMGILMNNGLPQGGEWTYDKYNREKYPKDKKTPKISSPCESSLFNEALSYVEKYFSNNLGSTPTKNLYPHDFNTSRKWLLEFLKIRFKEFGTYEDAILKNETDLHHSILSPMMNVGLISPIEVIETSLNYAKNNNIPINSTEGFIRQIIGWREFIRGIYITKGSYERTNNFWGFDRKLPSSFYNGTTGIEPFDDSVKKLSKTGYVHHIERLMIIGNFMLLCEIDPNEVYKWFMEFSIDSYDWVMVPNVYGMSQFADGGIMSTKPYISGSSYIIKMSDYKKGDWSKIWDALFWNFINNHKDFFRKNPRMRMLVSNFEKMDFEKKKSIIEIASNFIGSLN